MFGHQYHALNGDSSALEGIWNGSSRPLDFAGMMSHVQPIRIEFRDSTTPSTVYGNYWYDLPISLNPSNLSGSQEGKAFVRTFKQAEPFKAHFVERRHYIDFLDTNGNGILDIGEEGVFDLYGKMAFEDISGRMDGTTFIPFDGAGGRPSGRGVRNTLGDTTFLGANGSQLILDATTPNASQLFSFAKQNPKDWMQADNYAVDENGKIFDFRSLFNRHNSTLSSLEPNQVSDLYKRLNFERIVTSSKFSGRKVDVLFTPDPLLDVGFIEAKDDSEGL
jgi:hypothetical protein